MQITLAKDKTRSIKKQKVLDKIKHAFRLEGSVCYFIFLLLVGFLFFITSLNWNSFTTCFTGDYAAQQVSFYTHGYDTWWTFFTTGKFTLYDTATFLGVSNVGANSFYYLFDPFFFPILLCPRTYIAQGMAILTILKIALAGLFFYFYLSYLGASKTASKISGLAYAFCGWMAWYLWFNHMTEIVTVFPLVLLGVEKILKEKKPWLLIFSILLMSFTNYYFTVTVVICAFLYAIWRYFQRIKLNSTEENLKILGIGFLGFLCGCLSGLVILLPTCLYALNTSRGVGGYLSDLSTAFKDHDFGKVFKLIFDWGEVDYYGRNNYRSLYVVIEYVFPPVTCRNIPTVMIGNDSYEPEATSLFVYIPMMILLVPALINSVKNKHYSPLVALALFILMLCTPFTYYMMHGFSQPYSRWTIFPTICLVAYVGLYLDKLKDAPKWTLLVGGGSMLVLLGLATIFTAIILKNPLELSIEFKSRVPLGIISGIEAGYIVLVTAVLYLVYIYKRKYLFLAITGFITIETALVGGFVIEGQGVSTYQNVNNGWYNNEVLSKVVKQVKEDDPSYYRSYSSLATTNAENDGMRNNYNGLSFFHSLYNFNIDDFCDWSAIKGYSSWSGCYQEKRMGLDLFLGVKYYYVQKNLYKFEGYEEYLSDHYRVNVPLGTKDVSDKYDNDTFNVYESFLHNDFAFTFDSYYLATETSTPNRFSFSSKSDVGKEEVYISSAILYPNDEEYVLSVNDELTYNGTSHSQEAKSIYSRFKVTFYDVLNGTNPDRAKYASGLHPDELLALEPDNPEYEHFDSEPEKDKDHPGRYAEVYTVKETYTLPYDEDGYCLYLRAPFDDDNALSDIDVYMVDEHNKFILEDNHGDDKSGNKKGDYRGFYIAPSYDENNNSNHDAPHISKIIVCPRRNSSSVPNIIYYDSYSSVKERLKKNIPLNDIKYNVNSFTFTSNFEKPRIVVTQLPYEEGWSLVTTQNDVKENQKVFKAQGGFVAFMSKAGECSYELSFYPPHVKLGSYFSAIGMIGFFSSLIAYTYLDTRKRYLSEFSFK